MDNDNLDYTIPGDAPCWKTGEPCECVYAPQQVTPRRQHRLLNSFVFEYGDCGMCHNPYRDVTPEVRVYYGPGEPRPKSTYQKLAWLKAEGWPKGKAKGLCWTCALEAARRGEGVTLWLFPIFKD